jgi:type IV pilus assembly protein PilW
MAVEWGKPQRFNLNYYQPVGEAMKKNFFTMDLTREQLIDHDFRNAGNARGFTLVEMVIAMAVGLIVLFLLYDLFEAESKQYNTQEAIVEMQQNARAAMDMLTTEARMAGYDPTSAAAAGINAFAANSLTFTQDLNGDKDVTDPNETITYAYNAGNMRITRDTGGGAQPFAENIEALNFTYFNAAGGAAATAADIRLIRIMIRARTSRRDPDYTTNGGFRTFTLTSDVTPRNLAY